MMQSLLKKAPAAVLLILGGSFQKKTYPSKPSGFEAVFLCPYFSVHQWLLSSRMSGCQAGNIRPQKVIKNMTIENRDQIANVQQYYEILRTRQTQIIEIIKDTSQMLSKLDSQQNLTGIGNLPAKQIEKNLDSGIRLAFSMINALANILDEQMQALNVCERVLQEDKTILQPQTKADYRLQDYYEITSN
jgi:hypothetical protein